MYLSAQGSCHVEVNPYGPPRGYFIPRSWQIYTSNGYRPSRRVSSGMNGWCSSRTGQSGHAGGGVYGQTNGILHHPSPSCVTYKWISIQLPGRSRVSKSHLGGGPPGRSAASKDTVQSRGCWHHFGGLLVWRRRVGRWRCSHLPPPGKSSPRSNLGADGTPLGLTSIGLTSM